MTIHPLPSGACAECHHGYPGEHTDACSHSTATACVVCGRMHHQEAAPGVCLLRDAAHTAALTTSRERAA